MAKYTINTSPSGAGYQLTSGDGNNKTQVSFAEVNERVKIQYYQAKRAAAVEARQAMLDKRRMRLHASQ